MTAIDYDQLFAEQRDFLWGYCYRLTGSAADAEDAVQETFIRAWQRPPADTSRPWRPWLVRVATNLVRDAARKTQRRQYTGPWLPSPVETAQGALYAGSQANAEARYEQRESVSMAFLLALEALNPQQRAVLLLRDVYGDSVNETAETLDLSAANVKTTLHRARKALASYDASRTAIDPRQVKRTGEVLGELLLRLQQRDVAGIENLLAQDVCALSDGGGRFYAAKVPVLGRGKVALLYSNIAPNADERVRFRLAELNGLPALVAERPDAPDGYASYFTMLIDLDSGDQVRSIYSVLAPDKLSAITFEFDDEVHSGRDE